MGNVPVETVTEALDRLRAYTARLEGIIGLLPGEGGDAARQSMAYHREVILEEEDA